MKQISYTEEPTFMHMLERNLYHHLDKVRLLKEAWRFDEKNIYLRIMKEMHSRYLHSLDRYSIIDCAIKLQRVDLMRWLYLNNIVHDDSYVMYEDALNAMMSSPEDEACWAKFPRRCSTRMPGKPLTAIG